MRAEDVLEAGDVFDANRWSTQSYGEPTHPHLFENCCRMLARLTQDERALVLLIMRRYRWLKVEIYQARFLDAWRALLPQIAPSANTIAIVPLRKPNTKGPKSSDWMFGIATGIEPALVALTAPRQLRLCSTVADLRAYALAGTTVVLLDDYIGTGDTAIKCIKKLRATYSVFASQPLFALTLAAQSAAFSVLQSVTCNLVTSEVLQKGISTNPDIPNVSVAVAVMMGLEKKLRLTASERFGYGASEALVTLLRTPNNTFPVFWTNRKVKGALWPSPFPRIRHGH